MTGVKEIFKKTFLLSVTVIFMVSLATSSTTIDIQDQDGTNLNNFDIEITGEEEIERENIDRFQDELDEGRYNLSIFKTGYQAVQRTIFVRQGEDSEYTFTLQSLNQDQGEIRIQRINMQDTACKGESFSADVKVKNTGGSDEVVSLSAEAFGQIFLGNSFVLNSGKTKTYRFIFTGLKTTGERTVRMTVEGYNSSMNEQITIEDCEAPGSAISATGVDMELFPPNQREKAVLEEVVRVKGFVDGTEGRVPVNISIDGRRVAEIQTKPDGFFETYFRANKVGEITVTASSGDVAKSREIEVVPKPEITDIRAKEKVFEGEEFDVCVNVNSKINPKVVLLENNNVIETRNAKGEVCFTVEAPEPGEYNYTVRALTYGESQAISTEVKVLPQGPQAKSFPGQIETIKTEPGVFKVSLYNTNEEPVQYEVRLRDVNEEWVSKTKENVSLLKGGRETVYFYVSPQKEGEFTGVLEVQSGNEIIYSDSVNLFAGDTGPAKLTGYTWINVILLSLIVFFMLV